MNRQQATALFGTPMVVLLAPAAPAVAADYLTVGQAQQAIFPEARAFEPVTPQLDERQRRALAAAAGPQPPHGQLPASRGPGVDRAPGISLTPATLSPPG